MSDTQVVRHNFITSPEGHPAGGTTDGLGIAITWQNGPLQVGDKRIEPNGCFVETVIRVALERLEFYQNSKFRNNYNLMAIASLETALQSLDQRTKDREARGVEGTHET